MLCSGHCRHRQLSHVYQTLINVFTMQRIILSTAFVLSLFLYSPASPVTVTNLYVYLMLVVIFHNHYVCPLSPLRNHIPVQIPMKFLHSGMSSVQTYPFKNQ